MSRDLRFHVRARADISRTYRWLKSRSPQGAAAWADALFRATDRVLADPEGFPAAEEATPRWGTDVGQAMFQTKRGRTYRMIFDWTETKVRILRVRGPGQRPL